MKYKIKKKENDHQNQASHMLPFIVNINYRTLPSVDDKECGK